MPELFLATSVHKVDRKGRVSIPSRFRNAVAGSEFQGIVLFPPINPPDAPFYSGCSFERFQEYAEDAYALSQKNPLKRSSGDGDTGGEADTSGEVLPNTQQLPFDGEGRVVLPDAVIEHCGIEGEARFVGLGHIFKIWSPARSPAETPPDTPPDTPPGASA